jgi:hypothetical protein
MDEEYVKRFDPIRNASDRVCEPADDYACRMKTTVLPYWPEEVLIEWFHRHIFHIDRYAALGYERFRFERELWPLAQIPGEEAFLNPTFCQNFSNVAERAATGRDWLASYMMNTGTWNTPIVLLQSAGIAPRMIERWPLRQPVHLLEGHRRLAFLNGLRKLGKAGPEHLVWCVALAAA